MAADVHIRFLRFSAFYSPLLLTMAGGHLAAEDIEATYDIVRPDRTILDGIADGSVQVAQSATAVSFEPWAAGDVLPFRHFALMNCRDGFFIARRGGASQFAWSDLERSAVIADHFFQPMAMLRAALAAQGVDESTVQFVDEGDVAAIDRAFRSGEGDFVHLQGPAPQQLELDGIGRVVAAVGAAAPPIAFSSLCAHPDWLATDVARAFCRAYTRGHEQARTDSPAQIAVLIAPFLPDVQQSAIAHAVRAYQALGCWDGGVEIGVDLYDATVRLFQRFGELTASPCYSDVVAPMPR
jgi:NitT/TauT family transport system substrate-binding protein